MVLLQQVAEGNERDGLLVDDAPFAGRSLCQRSKVDGHRDLTQVGRVLREVASDGAILGELSDNSFEVGGAAVRLLGANVLLIVILVLCHKGPVISEQSFLSEGVLEDLESFF